MPIDITMPALSPTMEEGKLAKWHVKEGDSVTSGDVIAEIETDKATMEVEAVEEGTIAKLLVAEGSEGVKVNTVIAILVEEGEDATNVQASSPAPAPAPAPMAAVSAMEAPAPVAPLAVPAMSADVSSNGERLFVTPLARRIAEQNNIDLKMISGSGPNGRIVKSDVEGTETAQSAPAASMPTQSASMPTQSASTPVSQNFASGMSDDQVLAFYDEDKYETLPHNGMRRTIASRLTESTQTIPAYFLSMNCELDALLKLRSEINSSAPMVDEKPQFKVSVNDFIIKAMALALRDEPMANASWTSDARILHKNSDIGVAVAIEDGLITPIVRQAEIKSLTAISIEMKDLAGRARELKLKPEEYQGGSSSISNLGMMGVSNFTSIINPPQASIVSIGAGEKTTAVKSGEVVVVTKMNATFAFDHRVIDGALGAQLAGKFKNYIEKPMLMLV